MGIVYCRNFLASVGGVETALSSLINWNGEESFLIS